MALRATDGRQRAAAKDLRAGAYIAGTHRLFFVIAYLQDEDEVVVEDCHRPDVPQMWATTRFLTVNGPLWVIRFPEIAGSPGRNLTAAL